MAVRGSGQCRSGAERLVGQADDARAVVCEASSFQLEEDRHARVRPEVAVCST